MGCIDLGDKLLSITSLTGGRQQHTTKQSTGQTGISATKRITNNELILSAISFGSDEFYDMFSSENSKWNWSDCDWKNRDKEDPENPLPCLTSAADV